MEQALGIAPTVSGTGKGEPGVGAEGLGGPAGAPTAVAGAAGGIPLVVHAAAGRSAEWRWRKDGFPEPIEAARRSRRGAVLWAALAGLVLLLAGGAVALVTLADDSTVTVTAPPPAAPAPPTVVVPDPTEPPLPTVAPTTTPVPTQPPTAVPTATPEAPPTTLPTPTALPTATAPPTATPLPTATPPPTPTPTPADFLPPEILRFTSPGTACTRRPIDIGVLASDDVAVAGVVVDWTHQDGRTGSTALDPAGNGSFTGTVGPVTTTGDLSAVASVTDTVGNIRDADARDSGRDVCNLQWVGTRGPTEVRRPAGVGDRSGQGVSSAPEPLRPPTQLGELQVHTRRLVPGQDEVAGTGSSVGETWGPRVVGVMVMAARMRMAARPWPTRIDSPKNAAPIRKTVGSSAAPATAVRAEPIAGAAAA